MRILFLFLVVMTAACTSKKEPGPDWWYETQPLPDALKGLYPQAEKGFRVDLLVSNQEIREKLQGRTLELEGMLEVDTRGGLFFLARYDRRSRLMQGAYDQTLDKSGFMMPQDVQSAWALFRWSSEKKLELLVKEIDLFFPTALLLNPIDLKNCSAGSPVVFGSHRRKWVKEMRKGYPKGKIASGPIYARGICFQGQSRIRQEVVFDAAERDYGQVTGASVDPQTQQVWMSVFREGQNYFGKNLDVRVGEDQDRGLFLDALDLKTGKKTTLSTPKLKKKQFQLIRDWKVSSEGVAMGVGFGRAYVFCRRIVKGFDCRAFQKPDPYTSTVAFDGADAQSVFFGTASYSNKEGTQKGHGKVLKVGIKKSAVLAQGFYSVRGLLRSADGGVYVVDYAPKSNEANRVFKVTLN